LLKLIKGILENKIKLIIVPTENLKPK